MRTRAKTHYVCRYVASSKITNMMIHAFKSQEAARLLPVCHLMPFKLPQLYKQSQRLRGQGFTKITSMTYNHICSFCSPFHLLNCQRSLLSFHDKPETITYCQKWCIRTFIYTHTHTYTHRGWIRTTSVEHSGIPKEITEHLELKWTQKDR